jgi:hypothetical protein
VAESVGEAITELVAQVDDAIMGAAAMGAGVAAIFDQHDRGVGGAEDMVLGRVDRRVERLPVGVGRQNPSPASSFWIGTFVLGTLFRRGNQPRRSFSSEISQ